MACGAKEVKQSTAFVLLFNVQQLPLVRGETWVLQEGWVWASAPLPVWRYIKPPLEDLGSCLSGVESARVIEPDASSDPNRRRVIQLGTGSQVGSIAMPSHLHSPDRHIEVRYGHIVVARPPRYGEW
ncbi:uncharacterized protein EI90DRAFT_3021710 [Cantharellus anzutake]|uniref:uncharacterized protein n=1 Tax=Cantharellus anzutake TaxID=1750568 RepID=UPI001906BCD3|nr:uncharacterized protein EI90DRAFT_3021710 [Cantharellus anzutake]KAF8316018.1 hypothetical protein EI90DRAFT_3021710 [Cantharellus anzutake]